MPVRMSQPDSGFPLWQMFLQPGAVQLAPGASVAPGGAVTMQGQVVAGLQSAQQPAQAQGLLREQSSALTQVSPALHTCVRQLTVCLTHTHPPSTYLIPVFLKELVGMYTSRTQS